MLCVAEVFLKLQLVDFCLEILEVDNLLQILDTYVKC